jgi:NAD(P)-dependent dehydrogenase (short-subunit alcohol dehydrogenase family)
VAAKHGVVGLMRTLALELAPDMIRVNSVHPTTVNTDMIQNPATYALFAPDRAEKDRTKERLTERFTALNALPIRPLQAQAVTRTERTIPTALRPRRLRWTGSSSSDQSSRSTIGDRAWTRW